MPYIQFNSTIPRQNGQTVEITTAFKIKAVAQGGAFITKNATVTVVVCGNENVQTNQVIRTLYEYHTDAISAAVAYFPVVSNFTVDDLDCPILTYKAKQNGEYLAQNERNRFWILDKTNSNFQEPTLNLNLTSPNGFY